MSEEKRRFKRVATRFALEVVPSDAVDGTSLNLSPNGLLFSHEAPIEIGALLILTLRYPGITGSITVKGKVVRRENPRDGNAYNIAVAFVDLDQESEERLLEILEN